MSFLREMVAATREALRDPAYAEGVPPDGPSHRPSLRAAIAHAPPGGAVLAEFKRRSPGAADPSLPPRDAAEFLRQTASPNVVGYSCLAAMPRFNGSPADVSRLARATPRPVLFKEFLIEPSQLDIAARAGAAAVLLIARLEDEGLLQTSLESLARDAHARGLEVVLEFHDRAELRRAENVPADVYGVNVRDLDTLAIDRGTAAHTLAAAAHLRPLIGMSGVVGAPDARWFWQRGVDGILVGTALARAKDPPGFLAGLLREAPEAGP